MDISNTEIIKRYKENLMDTLPYIFPTLSDSELNRAIDYSINKRFKNPPCSVYNNYKEAYPKRKKTSPLNPIKHCWRNWRRHK